ncbi:MAG: hypothetical protein CMJ40_10655 [Phycisphaerae bacterium]|nr:hypothetical protein [Phycisphaerae bacterium]
MRHWTRSFPGLALLAVLTMGLVPPAEGALLLFDDELAFTEAIEGFDLELDEFTDLIDGYYASPIRRWVDDPSEYSLSSTSVVGLSAMSSQVTTVLPKSMISLQSETGLFRAMGANFGITDFMGTPITGQIRIQLQDGESFTWDVEDGSTFVGVVGVEEPVLSLTVGAVANAPLVTVGGVLIAAVPSPAAWPLVLLPVAGLSRRRRI